MKVSFKPGVTKKTYTLMFAWMPSRFGWGLSHEVSLFDGEKQYYFMGFRLFIRREYGGWYLKLED